MTRYLLLLQLITLCRFSVGVLIVGPKFVRSNQEYTVAIGNYFTQTIQLMLRMEVIHRNGSVLFPIQSFVIIPKLTNRMVKFDIPTITTPVDVTLNIQGQNGFSYNDAESLVFLSYAVSALIQINKPVFKPCEKIQFRVIVVDSEMKPPARFVSMNVTIYDVQQNVVGNWPSAQLHIGVFESALQIAANPILGTWSISVQLEEEELVSKSFEVKEYVLYTIDVQILTNEIPLVEHQALNLTITANYQFGKPAKGVAKLEVYVMDDKVDQINDIFIDGTEKLYLRFRKPLEIHDDQQDVRVQVTFVEQHTAQAFLKEQPITVYRHPYRVTLAENSTDFRPGYPFNCIIMVNHHDGSPAKNVYLEVEISEDEVEQEETYKTGNDGSIIVPFIPTQLTKYLQLIVKQNGIDLFTVHLNKQEKATNEILRLQRVSPIMLNADITFKVTCSQQMPFFVYYVVSKQNIVQAGFIKSSRKKKDLLRLKTSRQMTPKSTIVVATVLPKLTNEREKQVILDSLEMDFMQLSSNLDVSIDQHEFQPGDKINIHLDGRPNAYVGLAAYDRGLTEFTKHHDLFWEDVMQVFDGFHKTDSSEYDAFYSKGIFVKASGGVQVGDMLEISGRSSLDTPAKPKQKSLTTNFLKSWLWKNVTLGSSGGTELIEILPDTTTSWFLTGFSIDPVYGLGIIKKPIQFTTVQLFYIVDNLPYSIKRGEAALFQFTLFNYLDSEYIADVTLYNVDNQTEFIGRPLEDLSYTKSISVPPNVGVPVSFLVRPQKLGEMVVRVEASILNGLESDALEKVIRVMPESLVQPKTESRFICLDTNTNVTFIVKLQIEEKADHGLAKIEFRLNPNLHTRVIQNLAGLIQTPKTRYLIGEQNMRSLVPNIVVLDYLHAIGSTLKTLKEKATGFLRLGYQNQMRYRQKDGSFGVLRNLGGSVFLTAMVVKTMQTASKYINEVDATVIEKAFDWLASKQQSSGRIDEVGLGILKDMQGGLRNGISLTSYVLIAFLENENAKVKHAVMIKKGMNYLNNQFHQMNTSYDLSIATYAMMLNGHALAKVALTKLERMSTYSNYDTERYWESTNSVETTSYVLLSFVKAKKYVDGILIMRWLAERQYDVECIIRTQNCFIGIIALTKLAEKISPSRNNYTVQMKDNRGTHYFPITSQDIDIMQYENIPAQTRSLEFNVQGIGFGLLQVVYQYSLDLRNLEDRFNLTLEKQNTGSDYELRLRVCTSFIPLLSDSRSNMVLIEVNFPSGYVVDRNPISEKTTMNPIQHIEIRYGGTSVVVYYKNMGKETNCFTVTAFRRFKVALKRPAYVIVYDYYERNLNAIQEYEVDQQNVCEIRD